MSEGEYWAQSGRRALSRRRLLAGTSLAGAGLALATACGDSGRGNSTKAGGSGAAPAGGAGATGTAAARQPKRGGTVIRPYSLGGGSTHPFDAGVDPHPLQASYTGIMTLFYQTIVRLNPRSNALEPELAQKWEQPSPSEYLFHLQPGVKFHNKPPANGRLVTANDAVFSLNRVRTNDPRFQNRGLLDPVDKIEAVDPATIRVTTKAPNAGTLTNFAATSMAVLAPEVVDKAGKFNSADAAVGTGAFMLQSYDDTAALTVRNPDFWKAGLPYLDGVRHIYFADQGSMWAAFRSGQVHVTANPLPGPDAKQTFDQQQGKDYVAEWYKDVGFSSLQPNTRKKPFDDARVDRALRLLVDHEEAVNQWAVTWFGRGYLGSVFPGALDSWDFSEQEYTSQFLEFKRPKDDAVKEALSLLSAAGFSKDNPLKFTVVGLSTGFPQAEAELHQAQINRLGQGAVQISNLRLFDLPQLNSVAAQGDFEYYNTNLIPAQPFEPDAWFSTVYQTGAPRGYGKYSDATLDGMIDKQRTLFDLNQRKAAVKDMMRYMMDHCPYTSWSGRQVLSVYSPKVHNWVPEAAAATWGFNYEQVWFE